MNSQRGIILVLSLLFLAILTIVSLSSMTASTLQEKSSGNAFNHQLAFQSSETGLRAAETYVQQMTSKPTAVDQCSGNCNIIWTKGRMATLYGGTYQDKWWTLANPVTTDTWWKAIGHTMPSLNDPKGNLLVDSVQYISTQPQFIIEEIGYVPDNLNPNSSAKGEGLTFYRITSRGTGAESTVNGVNPSQVYVQSIYTKRYQ